MQVIIIEDDLISAEILTGLLQAENVSVVVETPPVDLDAVRGMLPQTRVVFIDLSMPGQSGYTVFAALRSGGQPYGVVFIAYTTHISEINEARRRRFDGFLGKPLDSARFPDHWQRILDGKPVWVIP